MDAPNPSAIATFASRTPLHIGTVGLIARDLDKLAAYYRDMLRLRVIERTERTARLGVGEVPLLELEHTADARLDDQREAGLYHTAFLMPTRADLARWVLHIARERVPVTGASDHGVSEAFYLDDPEGNGVEVYSDRPAESWEWIDGLVKMKTEPLDIQDIVRTVGPSASYLQAPGGLRVGHIHLRVGDVGKAEDFYRDRVGLAVTRGGRHGASFMSTGGYHHHLAGNVWHSAGAGQRDDRRAGLAWFTFEANDEETLDATQARLRAAGTDLSRLPNGFEARDPWGTRVRFVVRES
jgi:catechol 2,3-dioxygenase